MARLPRRLAARIKPHFPSVRMLRLNRRRALLMAVAAVWAILLCGWMLRAYSTELVDSYDKCAEEGYPISDTDPTTCTAAGHTFLGPRAATPPPQTDPVAGESVPFDILVNGDSRSDYPNRQEVIVTETGWEQYWRTVHAGEKTLPPLLPVDFTKNQVVALSEGQRGTTGYNLKVTSIVTTDHGSVVNVTETVPTITCSVADTMSNRYFIVRTPILKTPVSYRITTDPHHCE